MQTTNLTIGHGRQDNFGKAVLAIASVKAKEMHDFFDFEFWCASHLLLPQPAKKKRNLKPTTMIKIRLFSALIRKIIIVFITVFLFSNNAKSQDTLEYISRIGYSPAPDVARYGNYLYLANLGGLIVLDFSNPADAIIIAHITPPLLDLSEIIISGSTGYAAWSGAGIRNINFINETNPEPIGNVYAKKFQHRCLQKIGTILYAISTSVSTDSLYLTSINLNSKTISDSINLETGFPHSAFEAKRFIISDTLLYLTMGSRGNVADTSELHIFNISNPDSIYWISSVNIGDCNTEAVVLQTPTFSMVKRNNYIYVASRFVHPKNHIKIVDVSDPLSPQLTTAWTDTIIHGWSGDIDIDSTGNNLLLTDLYGGLNIISITNDTTLSLCERISNFIPADITLFEMRVFNHHAFLYWIDWYASYTVDLTNNSCNAILIDTISLGHDWRDVSASNTSYIFTTLWDYMQLYTLEMSNPNPLAAISQRTHVKGQGWGIDVEGNFAYCAMGGNIQNYPDSITCGGLIVFDISDPNNPIQMGWSPPDSLNQDVQVFVYAPNNLAYIIAGQPNGEGEYHENHISANPELRIIDVSNPDNLVELGSIAIPAQCRGIYKDGNYVYIAASSPDSCSDDGIIPITGLYIIDVSIPSSPVFAGINWVEYNHQGKTAHTRAVFVKDTIAYLAHDTSLVILNVSNPSIPSLVNVVSENCMLNTQTMDVIGWNNFLFVLTQNALFVYDITFPTSPVLLDSAYTFSFLPAKHLDVKPPYVYVLTSAGVYTFKFDALLTVPDIESSTNNINIYPNPFSNSTTLQIMNGVNTNYNLKIYDLFGREVKKYEIRNKKTEISRGNLPSGLYFYQVTDNKQFISSGKLIVL